MLTPHLLPAGVADGVVPAPLHRHPQVLQLAHAAGGAVALAALRGWSAVRVGWGCGRAGPRHSTQAGCLLQQPGTAIPAPKTYTRTPAHTCTTRLSTWECMAGEPVYRKEWMSPCTRNIST